MKILITTDLFTTATNGVVTSVRNLWEGLKSKGHDVRILTLSDSLDSYKDGDVYYIKSIPIGFVYPDVRMPISYRNLLIKELIDWKPEVIHSQCEFFSFQFAQRIAKLTGASLIHTYHTLYEEYVTYLIPSEHFGKHAVRELSRIRLEKADMIVAPTGKIEGTLRGYGVKNEIKVIPSGISLEQHNYRINEEERRQKRQTLGIPDEHHVLLSLGRIGTEKNLGELLQFFASALQKNEKLTFLIVGDGPDRKNMEKLSLNLGIDSHVILTGMVEPRQVQEYYQLADVFVSASTSETQGLTYIEAAANGLPLLCRQDDCLCDVIIEGVNGYEYTSLDEFLSKLNIIIENSEWRTRAGKHSEKIAEAFDKNQFVDAMEDIYKAMVNDVYVKIPVLENGSFLLREIDENNDVEDLLKVYSDEKAVLFFNSDNCVNEFYYVTQDQMKDTIEFWKREYQKRYYVRWAVVDKNSNRAIGTIELFNRKANDYFTDCGLLRVDLRSDYEKRDCIESILEIIVPRAKELFGCNKVATKAIPIAGERIAALEHVGFSLSDEFVIGHDGTRYGSYYVLNV